MGRPYEEAKVRATVFLAPLTRRVKLGNPTANATRTEASMARKASKTRSTLGNEGPPGAISKSEAVRRALADGVDQPVDGVAYILSQFGIEMGPQHFSAVKSAHLKKHGVPTVNTRFQKKDETLPSTSGKGEADLLAAMEAMKPLVASLGAEKVKRLVDLLG